MLPVVVQGVEAGQRQTRDPTSCYPTNSTWKKQNTLQLISVTLGEMVSEQQLPRSYLNPEAPQ